MTIRRHCQYCKAEIVSLPENHGSWTDPKAQTDACQVATEGEIGRLMPHEPAPITWTRLTKRTEDPKLSYLQRALAERGIPSRRNGHSFHAPIMEVPEEHADEAWAFLSLPARKDLGLTVRYGVTFDDVPDDHACFHDDDTPPYDYTDDEEHETFDPIRDGWTDKSGRP